MAQLLSTSYSIFLKLLRSELWQTPLELTLSHSEFLSVYELASKQAVLGMVANTFITSSRSKLTLFRIKLLATIPKKHKN